MLKSLFNKAADRSPAPLLKNRPQGVSSEYCQTFKKSFFIQPPVAAFDFFDIFYQM